MADNIQPTQPTIGEQAVDNRKKQIAQGLVAQGLMPGTVAYQQAFDEQLASGKGTKGHARIGKSTAEGDTRFAEVLSALQPENNLLRAIIKSAGRNV